MIKGIGLVIILVFLVSSCFGGEDLEEQLERKISYMSSEEKTIYDAKYQEYLNGGKDEIKAKELAVKFIDDQRYSQRLDEKIAQMTDEEKAIYETKYQEYLNSGEVETRAKSWAIKDVEKTNKAKAEAKEKLASEQKKLDEFNRKYESLSEENQQFYQKTYQELIGDGDSEDEAKETAMERALNKQKKLNEENAKLAKEQEKNLADAKNDLAKFEGENNVNYQELGGGAYNVTITYNGGYVPYIPKASTNDSGNYDALTFARICTAIVQLYNSAGVQVNHFTIYEIGRVQDSNGYISKDTVGICEFDNQKFPKNDYHSFYHKCSRLWVLEMGRVH